MKTKEIQNLKSKSVAELNKMVHDGRDRLRTLRLDLVAGKVKNVGELRALRKDIARMLTFVHAAKAADAKKTTEAAKAARKLVKKETK